MIQNSRGVMKILGNKLVLFTLDDYSFSAFRKSNTLKNLVCLPVYFKIMLTNVIFRAQTQYSIFGVVVNTLNVIAANAINFVNGIYSYQPFLKYIRANVISWHSQK